MAENFVTRIDTNLNGVLQTTQLVDGIMMTGDDQANQIIVALYHDRDPYLIPSGTKITGYFIRSDGITLQIDGSVIDSGDDEGKALVVIPALAYQVPGTLSIAVRMFNDPHEVQQRGYYEKIETDQFEIVTNTSVIIGPNGEPVITRTVYENVNKRGYYQLNTDVFVVVEDESVTEGPNGEPIVTIVISESHQERGYYKIEVGEFIIVDDPDVTQGPHGEPVIIRTITEYANKTVIASASCFVQMTDTDSVIEPGHLIPDINDVIAMLARMDEHDHTWQRNDDARATAEDGRVRAEQLRVAAENARVTVEAARVTAENARAQAESTRQSQESVRQQNEATRQSQETTRQQNEATRQSQESTRQTNEATRQSQERTRQSQETARQYAIQNMAVAATARAYNEAPTATITDVQGTGGMTYKKITFGLVPGRPFAIKKSFASIAEMNAYSGSDIELYDFVVITSNVEDPDNAKLYMKKTTGTGANSWFFITDLSGAQGIQGPKGDTGNGVASAVVNSNYQLVLTFTDGTTYTSGSIRGAKGETGATGNGISNAVINSSYQLVLTFTNGTSYTSGSIRGEKGEKGDKGDKGEPGSGGADVVYDATNQKLTVVFG